MKKLSTDPKAIAARNRRAAKKQARLEAQNQEPQSAVETPEARLPVLETPEVPKRVSKKTPHPALVVACPKCGAEAGAPCVSAKPPAYSVDIVHAARAKAHSA